MENQEKNTEYMSIIANSVEMARFSIVLKQCKTMAKYHFNSSDPNLVLMLYDRYTRTINSEGDKNIQQNVSL